MTTLAGTDAALLAAVGRDPAALEQFYRRHAESVLGFALRRCRDPHEAADLVSLVFLRVIDGAHTFDARRGTARAWLVGIAVRELADLRGGEQRRLELERRLGASARFDEEEYELAERRIDAQRCGTPLRLAARSLTPLEREMLLLVEEEGLTPAEAAAALGVRPVVARVRLARARARLRRQVDHMSSLARGATDAG